jgi:hypothetical protein
MTFRKFSSIVQYRDVIKLIRDHAKRNDKSIPTLTFIGTVKLHGTNAGIGYSAATGEVWAQSRERIITPFDDNAAFAKHVAANKEAYIDFLKQFGNGIDSEVVLYGEWAGPSIQKAGAISQLKEKAFFPFDLKVFTQTPEQLEVEVIDIMDYPEITRIPRVFRAGSFQNWVISIDFSRPQDFQNELVELTLAVEEKCPVAAEFGIDGIGEGIVWHNKETGLRFKVKGEKHSESKVTTVKQIAAVDLERMATVAQFVDNVVTVNRLEHGISKLGELGLDVSKNNLGTFIKWIQGDVLKEEMDVIEASCIEKKELMGKIAEVSKLFFFAKLKDSELQPVTGF